MAIIEQIKKAIDILHFYTKFIIAAFDENDNLIEIKGEDPKDFLDKLNKNKYENVYSVPLKKDMKVIGYIKLYSKDKAQELGNYEMGAVDSLVLFLSENNNKA